ncbi:MAG: MgtC/SapB family protein [Rhizobacter sp.]|nr:MgtC/SapB family protein [Rhizobacter sp.]
MTPDVLQLPSASVGLLTALACGLIVGLERGWRERELADGGRVAGLRTFALTGLLGGVFAQGGAWLLACGALGLAVLASVSYRESVRASGNLSVTSSVAMLVTFGLGAFAAAGYPLQAVSAAVVVAVLLDLRTPLHNWLRLMEHRELRAALQMLVLSAVILPLLPDQSYGPHGVLNPYRLWWAVVLIAGLSMAGHVAMRFFGASRGALWTGLLGGLASSTAATLALARQVREQPALLGAGVAGALAACAVMFLRIVVVLFALAPALARLMLPSLLAAAAGCLVAAWLAWRRRSPAQAATTGSLKPFDLSTALGFGVLLAVVAALSEVLKAWWGTGGLYVLALISGLADVDAITISMARMQVGGSLEGAAASVTVALAVLANMVVKVGIAGFNGGVPFGRRLAAGYALSVVAGAVAMAVVMAVVPAR